MLSEVSIPKPADLFPSFHPSLPPVTCCFNCLAVRKSIPKPEINDDQRKGFPWTQRSGDDGLVTNTAKIRRISESPARNIFS